MSVAMNVEMVSLLPAPRQAAVRMAGSRGGESFYEAVHSSRVPMYAVSLEGTVVGGEEGDASSHHDYLLTGAPIPFSGTTLCDLEVRVNLAAMLWAKTAHRISNAGGAGACITGGTVGDYWSNITRLRFDRGEELGSLEPTFMSCQTHLHSIELPHPNKITFSGNAFMWGCPRLRTVDLKPLSNLTCIGSKFLAQNVSMSSIDLTPLNRVTTIGDAFLSRSLALTSLDLTPLISLQRLGSSFLAECSALEEVKLGCLSALTEVPNFFLEGCASLRTIDLAPLKAVLTVGDLFMGGCASLEQIDLQPFSQVNRIGANFLANCTCLKRVDLSVLTGGSYGYLSAWGSGLLKGCSSMRMVSLPALPASSCTEDAFLLGCTSLSHIDLAPLNGVRYVGANFLAQCASLRQVELAPLATAIAIEHSFLAGCKGLSEVVLPHWEGRTHIGVRFLAGCTGIRSIDVSPLRGLRVRRAHFLEDCGMVQDKALLDLT